MYENLLELVVPLALTVGFIPFVYAAALLATYGSLFGRLNWKLSADKSTRRYAKRRAVRVGHVRLSRAQRLARELAWKLAPQFTRVEVDRAVEECVT